MSARASDVGTIVASFLLPPLGVYRLRGAGADFLVACALTVAGFLPGMVFAFIRLLGPNHA